MRPLDLSIAEGGLSLGAAYISSVVPAVARHYGLDVDALLAAAGITEEQLQQPDALIPFDRVAVLFLQALQMSGDPAFGLIVGSMVQPRSYQVLGYAILSCDTLGEAIDRLIRYEKLVGKLGESRLVEASDGYRLEWRSPLEGPWSRFLKEAAVSGWITLARQFVEQVPAFEVFFAHACDAEPSRYERVLGTHVHFNADFTGVKFAKAALQTRMTGADAGLRAIMDKQAAALLEEFDSRVNLVSEVRSVLVRVLPDGEPSLESVAQRLSLSERVLQSRLREAGASFTALIDDVRRSLAMLYLQQTNAALIDIAFLLGFSEQSAFSRAFRRWMGESPQAWRRHHQAPHHQTPPNQAPQDQG